MNRTAATLALLAALACGAARAEPMPYDERPEVDTFIREVVERHGFQEKELRAVFAGARREDGVLTAMQAQPAAMSRSWQEFRASFVNERLVKHGLSFWRENRAALERARRTYGVPEEIIVAILGVETSYGRNTGRWRVIDALATLAFDYPPRAPFFRGELENYLVFAREMELDVFSVKGSYAGAIGIPQFMPTSYLHYAVDFDGDGVSDLRGNAADAVGSVANFLQRHGWRAGEPVQRAARVNGNGHGAYADGNPLPRHSLEELMQAGVEARGAALPSDTRVALLVLQSPQRPDEFRLGLHNLYVLTRYNRNVFYGMAVSDLAEALRAARTKAGAAK